LTHRQRQDPHNLRSREDSAQKASVQNLRVVRFNTSIRQTEDELDVSYRSLRRLVERIARAHPAPSLTLSGLVEIDEVCVSAGLKGHRRDKESRSRGLSTRRRGPHGGDKPPVFTLVDRGTNDRYVVPAKSANESTVLLLIVDHNEESWPSIRIDFRPTTR